MKSLTVIILGLSISWHYTNLSSDHFLYSRIAPLGVFIFLVSFAVWLVLKAGFDARTDNRKHFGGSGGYGDAGDGGGCGGD